MEQISKAELLKLGGAPDALYAIFNADGSLYCCTVYLAADLDEEFWRNHERTIKKVIE